jgi:proteic killer suppression protein
MAIRAFRHAGLARFFATGSKAGIRPEHAARLRRLLALLDAASGPQELALPGGRLHPLKGARAGRWTLTVSGNWRVTFAFTAKQEVTDVDYEDYH